MDDFSGVIEENLPREFVMQRHRPMLMPAAHVHGHVEILLPVGCTLTYLTQTGEGKALAGRISVLWGQIPHRVSKIEGNGEVLIANLPLSELLSWSMPEIFLARLFAGELVTAGSANAMDCDQFGRWVDDYQTNNRTLIDVCRMELQLRLRRQSVEGWQSNSEIRSTASRSQKHSVAVQRMIRFMAENYRRPLTIKEIASQGGISRGHAMAVFQRSLNTSINSYVTNLRLHHARAALANSNEKILNIAFDAGFGSLSRFYEVFVAETGQTPRAYRLAQR